MGEDSHLHDLHVSWHSASVACCHAPRGHLTYILRPLPSQEFDAVKERLSKEKFEGGCPGEGARCGGSGAVHSIRTIHATIRAQPITHQLKFPGSICPPMPACCCGTAPESLPPSTAQWCTTSTGASPSRRSPYWMAAAPHSSSTYTAPPRECTSRTTRSVG